MKFTDLIYINGNLFVETEHGGKKMYRQLIIKDIVCGSFNEQRVSVMALDSQYQSYEQITASKA